MKIINLQVWLNVKNNHIFWNYYVSIHVNVKKDSAKILLPNVFFKSLFYTVDVLW